MLMNSLSRGMKPVALYDDNIAPRNTTTILMILFRLKPKQDA